MNPDASVGSAFGPLRSTQNELSMRGKILTISLAIVVVIGTFAPGCKKAPPPVKLDPHSPEAAMRVIMEQGVLLNDAARRKDYQFIHDNMYYLQSLAKALFTKLNSDQKGRLKGLFDELSKVTDELDHSAGRRHEEATQATMKKLQELLRELESGVKKLGSAQGRVIGRLALIEIGIRSDFC